MDVAISQSPARQRTGFGIMLAGVTVMMAGASAPSPFYPVLQERLGFSALTLTLIFAVYALALLATLLVAGSLSDHLGRRPVLSAGFVLLAIAVLGFWQAGTTAMLIWARVLQGIASALLLSTLSAAVVDLEPADRPGTAAIWNSVLPLCGLALGAPLAGLIMDHAADPARLVFGGLSAGFLLLALAVRAAPETAPRHEGILQALRPRIGLPPRARGAFLRSIPAVIAGWATGGLYLSLGAAIVAGIFHQSDHMMQAMGVLLTGGAGSLSCYLGRNYGPRQVTLYGTAALSIGTLMTLAAIAAGSLPLYLLALVVAGTGFGTCFYGVMRSVIPLAEPEERGELFAALFTLSYVAFGLPCILAGLALPVLGLETTVLIYGAAIACLSALAGLWRRFGTTQ